MKRVVSMVLVCCLFIGVLSAQGVPEQLSSVATPTPLLVYAGAGLKKPMEEIKASYEKDHLVDIQYIYAGSGQLISQIQLSGKGDVFIVGSEEVYKIAQDKGFANEPSLVAHHTPCIAVASDNPKHIVRLEDLAKDGVSVILGDPKANAIGLSAQEIIKKNNLQGIIANTVSQAATVNEIVIQLTMGQADAAIVTKDSISGNSKVKAISIPEEQNIDQLIPVGTLTMSKYPSEAQAFMDFICSEEGKTIFEKYGFDAVL
ncbi:molybdate ABC transporter substrate-binding protein [uncultured Sphaerochaeta sp.]|uniref:molybdate ABC transporter substrate-binding protein n=1 Tax=uncultured Sphaerochaeta sp. TaxID=886478 RepID=UPI002A0A17F3|nr:molybdate ABC transporter substrate-binding protein [uncultured Sphaerochaeta sp.]